MTQAIPKEFDYVYDDDWIPVQIYLAIKNELEPSDMETAQDLWDEFDNFDLDKDYGGNLSKLAAGINLIHKRLKDNGETVSLSQKIRALVKSLRPVSKYKTVIYDLEKKNDFTSFTHAVSYLKTLVAANNKILKKEAPHTPSPAPTDINSELLMFKQYQEMMRNEGQQQNYPNPIGRGRRGGGRRGRGGRTRGGRGRNRGRRNGKRRNLANVQCYVCNGYGHYARNCPTDTSWKEYLQFKALRNNPNNSLFGEQPAEKKVNINQSQRSFPNKHRSVSPQSAFKFVSIPPAGDLAEPGPKPLARGPGEHKSRRRRENFENQGVLLIKNDSFRGNFLAPMYLNYSEFLNKNDDTPCLDSGASVHFFNKMKYFSSLHSMPETKVSLGEKGGGYRVNKRGCVTLIPMVNDKRYPKVTLTNVIFAPRSPGNFISTSALDLKGFSFRIKNGLAEIRNPSNKLAMQAHLNKNNNLYFVKSIIEVNKNWQQQFKHFNDAERLCSLSIAELMHRRFGHASVPRLNATLKKLKAPTLRGRSLQCTACELTGTKRPNTSTNKPTTSKRSRRKRKQKQTQNDCNNTMSNHDHVMQNDQRHRVSSDVKTMPKSCRGFKYFSVFVHEPTRFVRLKKMKTKGELEQVAIDSIKWMEKQGTVSIVEFRSDYEQIYRTTSLLKFLDENGIVFSPSTPYRHEQNGISERIIQTLLRKMRANLRQCGLTNVFWCYAIDAAAHVYNRTVHSSTGKIPFVEFTGGRVNLDNFVVFGCIGVAHIDEDKRSSRHNLDRGVHVRMIGYDEGGRNGTYLVCDRHGKIFRARVAKWHEDVYTFSEILNQMPKHSRRATEESRSSGIDADEQLRQDEAELKESLEAQHKEQQMNERMNSRARRKRNNRLRFIPGVNYAPGMHYLNHLHDGAVPDADARVLGPAPNARRHAVDSKESSLEAFIKTTNDECIASSKDETKLEHWLGEIKISVEDVLNIPKSFRDAVTGPEKERWIPGIKDEIKSLREKKVWRVMERQRGKNLVSMKWVFRKKVLADGSIRYKVRLVARGFTQKEGEDFFQTHAPTLSLGSLRMLLALSSRHRMNIHNIDIKTAFLYGNIDADITCKVPEGLFEFDDQISKEEMSSFRHPVLKMDRAVYGLKQAGFVWFRTYTEALKSWGFRQCHSDPCIFIKEIDGRKIIVGVYVDDTIICHESKADLEWFLGQVGKHFDFHNEGELKWALGMEVGRCSDGTWWIGQKRYIGMVAQKFEPIRSKVTTPLQSGLRLDFQESSPPVDPCRFRSLLGSLLYVAVGTRPDISFACSRLAQFAKNPRQVHFEQALRVLQYLKNTIDRSIHYDRDDGFTGFADASFELCKQSGKSFTGYVLFYAGAPVLWRSFKQTVVAGSTGEAEYMALSPLCKEVVFATQLCGELKLNESVPTLIFDDSEPAIAIAMGTGLTKRSRSVRLSYHNVRDCVGSGLIHLRKVSGKTNPADVLTKPLSAQAHGMYCNLFFRRRR